MTMLTGAHKFKVYEATENTKETCVAKGWRVYRKKNGDEVKLRHVLEKLSKWVGEAIKIVDLGVSFDQSGHSALPWGIVKFILTTGKSNIDVFSSVVEGMESISSLITRYTVVENLYLRGSHEATTRLRQSIKEFYAAILTYLAKAKSFFSGSSVKQTGRGLIEAARQQYDMTKVSETDVQRWMRLVDAELHRETSMREIEHYDSLEGILLELNKPITRMTSQLEDLHDHFNNEKRKEVFRWMSQIEYKSHHEDLSKGLLPNSGQWLLDHKLFIEWGQSSVSSILWLHGIPGSGKTRLVSRIIDVVHDEGQSGHSPSAFFYCARSTAEPERGKPVEILGAILRQLCSSKPDKPIRGPVAKEYEVRRQKAEDDCSRVRKLTVEDCTRLILELTEDNPATIVIDALDECDEETRHELLEALDIIISNATELVRVLVSSRDDVDITLHLDSCNNISISADCNGGDIARFVVSEVDRLISKKLLLDGNINKKLRCKLIDTLTSGAQGMFRWVAMSLETLQQIKFRPDFEKALGQLPSKLSGLYDIVHSQIGMTESYGRDLAIKTLKWLLCAQRLMSAKELIAAVTLPSEGSEDSTYDPDDDSSDHSSTKNTIEKDLGSWSPSDESHKNDIIRSCRNLVAIDAQHEYFRFAHQSVREYLLAREEYTTEKQHALAAERCLDVYLTKGWPNFVNAKFLQGSDHLRLYSRIYWPVHYENVQIFDSQDLTRKISTFMTKNSATSPAYLQWASEFESRSVSNEVIDLTYSRDEHFDQRLGRRLMVASGKPSTYLSALCAFGFFSLMKDHELSFKDCNQSIRACSGDCYSLLSIASLEGHDQIVERLLAKGADVNAQIDDWPALHYASHQGYESIVRILLDKGAHADLSSQNRMTALLLASESGHVSVVILLLKNGADVNAQDKWGDGALHHAASEGYESVVRCLLDHEADVNARNERGDGALNLAVKNGYDSVVQCLLDHGADVNTQSYYGRSALHQAAKAGNDAIATLLLNHGADINTQNENGWSALHYASDNGHISIVEMLLNHEADIKFRSQSGASALFYAFGCGRVSIVKMLLDHEADIDARTKNGENVLHYASKNGHISTVKMLLNYGADIDARTKNGESVLHFASTSTADVVDLLLSHGADVNARNDEGESVIDWAREQGSYREWHLKEVHGIIQLLLDHGAIDTPPKPETDSGRVQEVMSDVSENEEDSESEEDSGSVVVVKRMVGMKRSASRSTI